MTENTLTDTEREALILALLCDEDQQTTVEQAVAVEKWAASIIAARDKAAVAAALAPIEALAEQPDAPYPADCGCPHGMGFQFHRFPCKYAGEITKSALRAALAGGGDRG